MSQRVGFIGLGNIGQPMAECIARKGFELTVFELRKEPLTALSRLGANVAGSCKEVGERSDVIITMVLDAKQTEAVILGPEGVLAGAAPGAIIVIMSTIAPAVIRNIHRKCAEKGVDVIGSPVTGGPHGAAAGTITLMVDGDPALMEKARPVLEAMGKKIFHYGEIGAAQVVKAAKNLISNSTYVAINEAAAMVMKAGVDPEHFFRMVRSSTGDCAALHDKVWYRWWLRKHDTPETIYVTVKDTKQAVDLAKEMGLHLEHGEALAKMDIETALKMVPRDVIVSKINEEDA